MAFVERHPEHPARAQHGSIESHASASNPAIAPAPANAPRRAPESLEHFERFTHHPVAKLALKAAGIVALLLGLAGIGALSMKKGFSPKLAMADSAQPASSGTGWLASQASLVAATTDAAPAPTSSAESHPRSPGMTEDGRVILNLATVEDLRHLPGVGQKRAEAIIALRQKLGKFKRPSDLLRVRGIGARRLKQLLPKLLVDPPPAPSPAAPSASSAPSASTGH